jgi:hypothetical protein
MFIHWLVGMVYIFYFASFVLLLREIIRPGVLWFLRNLNDPDFHPVQEMIQQPTYRHARRFLLSSIIFGSAILVIIWLPTRIIHILFPGFLPYRVQPSSEAPMSELSMELFVLQVILPALLEKGHTRAFVKGTIRQWIITMATVLTLHSYLLGKKSPQHREQSQARAQPEEQEHPQPAEGQQVDNEQPGNNAEPGNGNRAELQPEQRVAQALGALGDNAQAHLAVHNHHHGHHFVAFEPYQKPSKFHIRVHISYIK